MCCDATWASYLKAAPPQIPSINFTVGGLGVGLRPNDHTVQIFSLAEDPMPPFNFSFVPPLAAWNRAANRGACVQICHGRSGGRDRTAAPLRSPAALPGCHQLGDITLRIQARELGTESWLTARPHTRPAPNMQPLSTANTSAWALFTTAWAGYAVNSTPVPPPLPAGVLVADDVTPLLLATPNASRIVPDIPLSLTVVRSYEEVRPGGQRACTPLLSYFFHPTAQFTDEATGAKSLLIRFNVTATADTRVGGFGASCRRPGHMAWYRSSSYTYPPPPPIISGMSVPADDNTDQDLNRIAYTNSFVDPHIGSDHAWAEWVRIVGNVSLLVRRCRRGWGGLYTR